ncbi:MAG: DUF4097 family beta strand repeat-containing protein [Woeseiaceae bacterium]|nr:DUF4097 family beta strand repeat-containing protein [Woeseiaceae bacterium]
MNRILVIALGMLLAVGAGAREVNETIDADRDGTVSVYNTSGSIEVSGWSRNEVEVTGTVGDDAEEFIFERSGKTTTIKVKIPNRSRGHRDVSANLVIRVPEGSSLDIATVSADIDVEDVKGEQELQAVSGDISTTVFGQDISAETVSGDLDVTGEGGDGESRLTSVSGDIEAEGLVGEIDAEVVSGDIDISRGSFERAKVQTVNGDITYIAALRPGGRIDMETVNGSIDIEFVGDVSARFDIETFNGRIKNCFGPKAERVSKYAPGWELSFTEGSGDGRVSINTLNGNLDMCKE